MGPTWPFLLMNGSHDMRHTGFPQVDGGQRDTPGNGASQQPQELLALQFFIGSMGY